MTYESTSYSYIVRGQCSSNTGSGSSSMHVSINNVKVSFSIKPFPLSHYKYVQRNLPKAAIRKEHGNFTVIRYDNLVISVFSSGFINLTGIKSLNNVRKAWKKTCRHVLHSPSRYSTPFSIDNISASGTWPPIRNNFFRPLSPDFITTTSNNIKSVKYNNQRFPGMFLKTSIGGVIIVYKSGNFVIVGSRSTTSITHTKEIIKNVYPRA